VLADVQSALDACERDWAAYHRTTVALHRADATAWAGVDRIAQIDPDFVPA
jgi:CO dehydrogenase maturation factor